MFLGLFVGLRWVQLFESRDSSSEMWNRAPKYCSLPSMVVGGACDMTCHWCNLLCV